MPEIISAKCFGCGHVVKVPAALGGKKARCPKCTNTITIPSPGDSSEDFVSDAMLPEVAREDDPIEGELIEEDDAAPADPASDPAARRPRSSSAWTKPAAPSPRTREAKGGTRLRGGPPPRRGSSTGLIIGIAVAVLAVIVVIVAVAAGGSKPQSKQKNQEGVNVDPKPDSNPAAEAELEARCMEYFSAVRQGNHTRTMDFYAFEPSDKLSVAKGVTAILERSDSYKGATVKSAHAGAETGSTIIMTDKEATINWRKVDGVWKIADKP